MMPGWCQASDFAPGVQAAWHVEVDGWRHLSCWPVPVYERGQAQQVFLVLRAERGNGNDGGLITLAISEVPRHDIYYTGRDT